MLSSGMSNVNHSLFNISRLLIGRNGLSICGWRKGMPSDQSKTFQILGLRKEKIIFNQRNRRFYHVMDVLGMLKELLKI